MSCSFESGDALWSCNFASGATLDLSPVPVLEPLVSDRLESRCWEI